MQTNLLIPLSKPFIEICLRVVRLGHSQRYHLPN